MTKRTGQQNVSTQAPKTAEATTAVDQETALETTATETSEVDTDEVDTDTDTQEGTDGETGGDELDSGDEQTEEKEDTAPAIITGDEEGSDTQGTLENDEDCTPAQIQDGAGSTDTESAPAEEAKEEVVPVIERSPFEETATLTSIFKALLRDSFRYQKVKDVIDVLVENFKDNSVRAEFENEEIANKFIEAVKARQLSVEKTTAVIAKVSFKKK